MKKYLAGILVLLMILSFALVACDKNPSDAAQTTPVVTTPAATTPADNGGDDAACEHAYDNACDATCNTCNAERTPAAHAYDNACDASCNVCGATRTPAAHVYDNACDASCNVCGATRTPSAHAYDNACDKTCNVCGATRTVGGHTYDANGVCTECGVTKALVESGPALDGWGTPFPY